MHPKEIYGMVGYPPNTETCHLVQVTTLYCMSLDIPLIMTTKIFNAKKQNHAIKQTSWVLYFRSTLGVKILGKRERIPPFLDPLVAFFGGTSLWPIGSSLVLAIQGQQGEDMRGWCQESSLQTGTLLSAPACLLISVVSCAVDRWTPASQELEI
jgi:hypothetical protein